jgi:DUF4097 and DUF4098 domain-containing protein YvlB
MLLASFSTAEIGSDSKAFPPKAVRKLIVETDSGAINLIGNLDTPVTVRLFPHAASTDSCDIKEELIDDTLRVSAHGTKNALGISKTCSAGFEVAAQPDEVQARSGSGDVTMAMPSRRSDIRTGSGSIELVGAGNAALRTGSGRIHGTVGSDIDAGTGSGDIHLFVVNGVDPVSIKAKTGSGTVSLEWKRSPVSGKIDVSTGSGDLNAFFSKDTKLNAKLHSAVGRIRNDFDNNDSKLLLTFNSGSGAATITRKP